MYKKIAFLLFLGLFLSPVNAYIEGDAEILSQKYEIKNFDQDQIQVIITREILAKSDQIRLWEALPAQVQEQKIVQNKQVLSSTLLQNQDQAEALWQEAISTQSPYPLNLSNELVDSILQSPIINTSPEQKIILQTRYLVKPLKTDDFFSFQFLDFTKTPILNYEIEATLPQTAQHTLSTLNPEDGTYLQSNQNAYHFETQNYTPSPLPESLWWSYNVTPKLSYQSPLGEFFQAEFLTPVSRPNFDKILFVIDNSGSMWGEKSETVPLFLETWQSLIPSQTKVQALLVGEETTILSDSFGSFSQDLHTSWSQKLNSNKPLGTVDWQKVKTKISQQELHATDLVIILTDETSVPQELYSEEYRFLFFAFGDIPESTDLWAAKKSGFAQQILSLSNYEASEFYVTKLWNDWQDRITRESTNLPQVPETVPFEFLASTQEGSPFWINKQTKQPQITTQNHTQFLSNIWAMRKIAIEQNHPSDTEESVNELSKQYGIKKENLPVWELNNKFIQKNLYYPKETFYFQGKSLYPSGVFLTDTTFQDQTDDITLKMSPLSEAQKNVYLSNPKSFGPLFAQGNVQYCFPGRCLSVTPEGGSEIWPGDTLLFDGMLNDHWVYEPLGVLASKGIVLPEKEPNPLLDDSISRAEFSWLIAQAMTNKDVRIQPNSPFDDVPDNTFGKNEITYLKNKNIIQGYEDGTFRPERILSRAEAVKILLSAKSIPPNKSSNTSFSDVSGWSLGWIEAAKDRKFVEGFTDGTFKPNKKLNRAEAYMLIYRIFY